MGKKEFIDISLERDELHRRIGRLPTSSLMLLDGYESLGKSILSQRLTYGALKHGWNVTFVSNELSTQAFIRQMNSVNYSITDYLLKGQLLFIPMFPKLGKVKYKKSYMENLMNAKQLFENDIIIIDSLSYLLVEDNPTKEDCFNILHFFERIVSQEKFMLLTIDPRELDESLLNMLRSNSNIHFELNQSQMAGEKTTYVEVCRFERSELSSKGNIPFSVEPKQGLRIEIAEVV